MHTPLESMFNTLRLYETIAHAALWTFATVGAIVFIVSLSVLMFTAVRAVTRRLSKRLGAR